MNHKRAWQEYRRLINNVGQIPEQTEAGLRKLLSQAPNDNRLAALCHNDLGVLLAARGEEESARQEFHTALTLESNCQAALENLQNLPPQATASPIVEPPNKKIENISQPTRVALVSMLFNWPAAGGGIYDTVAVGKGLQSHGIELKHFYVTAPELVIGRIKGESPLPSVPIPMTEESLDPVPLKKRLREAVAGFAPDKVLITDSWNFKSHLLEALKDFPCYLRFHAAENLCPLNNIRYLPEDKQNPRCRFNFLATPETCLKCLQENRANSGGLHNWERALSGVEGAGYYDFLQAQLAQAAGGLVNNVLIGSMFSTHLPNTRVVTSGVNTSALFRQELADPSVKTLLMSGVVEEGMKGFSVLRKAGEILRQKRQDFQILLTGRQAGQLNEYTYSVGWQSQEKLRELYAQADICIVPSVCEEAFGIVAVEAMAAGRPVIASRVGGLQFSVIDGVTGMLFEPGETEELAEKIVLLLDDADLRRRLGIAARQHAAQYDWQKIIERDYLPILGI